MNSAKLVSSSKASVTTDKTDYAPGQIVTITGSGFQPNEQVDIYFHEFPEEYPDIFLSAVANQQGNFVVAEFAPQEIDLGRIFTLTAIGLWRRCQQDQRRHLCGHGGRFDYRHDQLQQPDRPLGRELRDREGNTDGDAGGEQFSADLQRLAAGGDRGHLASAQYPARWPTSLLEALPAQTSAGTYAVTADFVSTDTTNYNSLIGLSAGNFVIQKATPTATLAVSNSPQTYSGSPQCGDR